MQPYQEASEEIINQSNVPGNILKKTATSALTLAGGSAALNKIMPFLNKHIPSHISKKGLEKIDPRFGKFIDGAIKEGHSIDETLDFIKDQVKPSEEKLQQKNSQDNRNIIQQYSPELHEFISYEIQKGRNPLEAGALAQMKKEFKQPIEKLIKDHKAPFSALLQTVYGANKQMQSNQPQQIQQQAQQPQQSGQGQQALMSILQKIQQQRGG